MDGVVCDSELHFQKVWAPPSRPAATPLHNMLPRKVAAGLRKIPLGRDEPEIYVVSEVDARLEARQCRPDRQIYVGGRSGISLREGDVVIDAGANIGSFARTASQAVGPDGLVLAAEPLPLAFEALQLNVQQHAAWAERGGLRVAPIVAVQYGLGRGDSENGGQAGQVYQVPFTFFPRCAALSTMYRDDTDAMEATAAIVLNATSERACRLLGPLEAGMSAWMPWPAMRRLYLSLHERVFCRLYLSGAQQVLCPMTTVSHLIEEHNLSSVALLKINVERAEEDVLHGIKPEHWSLIQQVSMQAHDLDGRLDRLELLLRQAGGFAHVVRWQEPRFRGSSPWMVYASRRAPADEESEGAAGAAGFDGNVQG